MLPRVIYRQPQAAKKGRACSWRSRATGHDGHDSCETGAYRRVPPGALVHRICPKASRHGMRRLIVGQRYLQGAGGSGHMPRVRRTVREDYRRDGKRRVKPGRKKPSAPHLRPCRQWSMRRRVISITISAFRLSLANLPAGCAFWDIRAGHEPCRRACLSHAHCQAPYRHHYQCRGGASRVFLPISALLPTPRLK